MSMDAGLLAYVGPGPGLTMFWAFMGLLGTIGLAILSLLLWPIRMLMKQIRGGDQAEDETTETPAVSNAAAKTTTENPDPTKQP